MGRLLYNQERDQLELDGHVLHCGDVVDLRMLGSWHSGFIARDASGWYFVTPNRAEIRPQEGLLARFSSWSPQTTYPAALAAD